MVTRRGSNVRGKEGVQRAVEMRHSSGETNPARQLSLQPVAIGPGYRGHPVGGG